MSTTAFHIRCLWSTLRHSNRLSSLRRICLDTSDVGSKAPFHNCDKTCKKSRKTCTSLADLISIILCVYNITHELAANHNVPWYQPLLAECAPMTGITDMAPPISLLVLLHLCNKLQAASFIVVAIRDLVTTHSCAHAAHVHGGPTM